LAADVLDVELAVDAPELLDDELLLSDFDPPSDDDDELLVLLVSFLVELELEPLSLLSASRAEPNVPAERLSVL
jgi:hypothetical protein